MSLIAHTKLVWEYLKINAASAMAYRANFIIKSITMILNDSIWLIFWWIFMTKFESANTWVFQDIIILYAVLTFSFGASKLIAGNRSHLAEYIVEGRLDFFLTLPKNVLVHSLLGRTSWFAFGDMLFGLTLAIVFLSPAQFPLYFLLTLISGTIFTMFAVLVGSLPFFWGSAQETSKHLRHSLVAFSSFPLTIFDGAARIILLTIIPAGLVSSVPVQLLKEFSLQWLLYSIGFTIILTIVSVTVFYIGLRRYESGNMIGANV